MSYEEPLTVERVHLYELENATAHHTDKFELVHLDPPTPVLRRGQVFNIAMRFDREYINETDIVRLLFSFGPNPSVYRGTRGINTIRNSNDYSEDMEPWGVRLIAASGTDLTVEVTSPVDSPIGVWQLNIETTTIDWEDNSFEPNTYNYERDIYLLFNPWLKDDLVYMEEEMLLDEYVLNDVGKIWVGNFENKRGRPWIFGQFDKCILPACQLLLDRSGLNSVSRGDPIRMSRAISKIVNALDDEGVLQGCWDGEYSEGTAPSAWTGSIPILEEFLETGKEVKYGQCWVFAGVVTTVCRALGLPSRVVTNWASAHDANGTLSVDRYYSYDLRDLEYDPFNANNKEDSVWNYHVWNDAWMARPDLPNGYGGWQAIDATPQETSDGMYQCGPSSLEAIKVGAVGYNYDTAFMLASVNADLLKWRQDHRSNLGFSKISTSTYHIGKMVATKAPFIYDPNGDADLEDITDLYKPREGTNEERLSLYRAVRSTAMAKRFYFLPSSTSEDVKFSLVDIERVSIGEAFRVSVNIHNTSDEERTIKIYLSATSVYYTGVKANLVKKASGEFLLVPYASEKLTLTVQVEDYLHKLVEYCMMKLNAEALVLETNQPWTDEDDFEVLKPTISIQIDDQLVVGRPAAISLSFQNPLKIQLTNCKFYYAGPGLSENKILEYRDVEPEEEIYIEHQLIPRKAGEQKIVATFTSQELVDITGTAVVQVYDEDE